ncbi:MAG: HAMP domain-containing sensor histidine kinase [Cyanobacteriota bacterium]|nr:HAMP domain-containing sensor histidine kinase [Cyanobacteriota bacterium]
MAKRPVGLGLGLADGLRLLLCWLGAGLVVYGGYRLLLRTALEPELLAESSLRISRNVQLVEQVLAFHAPSDLPSSVVLERMAKGPPGVDAPLDDFDRQLQTWMARNNGMQRRIVRDRPPLREPQGGHWILLRTPRHGPDLWMYYPERLSSTLWYLPMLRLATAVMGLLMGTILFLNLWVEQPLKRLTREIPDTLLAPLPLLPERGISPIRLLSLRVNRLLERINSTASTRRNLLRGLIHDLSGPHSRLMLRVEQLQQRLPDSLRSTADAMAADLQQLSRLTEQLALLAEPDTPPAQRRQVAIDDLCGRIAASYPAAAVELKVPRLIVRLDGLGLERCLLNLIDNALDYGAPPVVIRARRQGSNLRIQVDDHGRGLASATLLTMPRQSQADDRQRRRHLGLGLEIVERFCRDHGGTLHLGDAPSGGLRAELILPQ